jgi:hypothetical protein
MPAADAGLNAGSRLREPRRLSAPPPSLAPRRQVCVSKIVKIMVARQSALRAACRAAPARGSAAVHIVQSKEFIVLLIAYYVVFMIAGDLAAYAIGLVTEIEFGGYVSLIVFLALYFLFLWIAWVLAVWLTKPKHAEPQSARPA